MSEILPIEDTIYIPYQPKNTWAMDTHCRLEELNRLLVIKLEVEDLSPGAQLALEQKIKDHRESLGLNSLDDFAKLEELWGELYEFRVNPPLPTEYPSKKEFKAKVTTFVTAPNIGRRLLGRLTGQDRESLPQMPETLRASDISRYAHTDWHLLQQRSSNSLPEYIYQMGISMSHEYIYTISTPNYDHIVIGRNWNIENGRHRCLALKVLGAEYILNSGMDEWVKVLKDF